MLTQEEKRSYKILNPSLHLLSLLLAICIGLILRSVALPGVGDFGPPRLLILRSSPGGLVYGNEKGHRFSQLATSANGSADGPFGVSAKRAFVTRLPCNQDRKS